MLCQCCQVAEGEWCDPPIPEVAFSFLEDMLPFIQIPSVQHHKSPSELKDCADETKCPLCKLIYATIIRHQHLERDRQELLSAQIVLERFGCDDGAGTNAGIRILIGDGRWGTMDVYPMKGWRLNPLYCFMNNDAADTQTRKCRQDLR